VAEPLGQAELDHWARVGRAVSIQHTASRRRIEAALAGDVALTELSVEEGVVPFSHKDARARGRSIPSP
jgi:ParD-like antitoxin of type II bacterial toxin-antitoxin system